MSVERATVLTLVGVFAASVVDIVATWLATRSALKASRESSFQQSRIARESWAAEERISLNDARIRWTMERLEKLAAGIWAIHDLVGPDSGTRSFNRTWLADHIRAANVALTGLLLDPENEFIVSEYRKFFDEADSVWIKRRTSGEANLPEQFMADTKRIARLGNVLEERLKARVLELRASQLK